MIHIDASETSKTVLPENERISDLATKVRVLFEREVEVGSDPDMSKEMQVMLRADEGQVLNDHCFESRLRELGDFLEDPSKLLGRAEMVIRTLLEEKGSSSWTDEDIQFLAAHLAAPDVDKIYNLRGGKGVLIPNPWYLGLPRYLKAIDYDNGRGDEKVIQPANMSMKDWIDKLTSQSDSVVKVLDIGAGSGDRLKDLKDFFDNKIETIAVGLANQTMWVDVSLIRPMEILPMNLGGMLDVVMSNFAIAYSAFPKRAIGEALRVLRPGKKAFLSVARWFKEEGINSSTPYKLLGMEEETYFNKIREEGIGRVNIERMIEIIGEVGGDFKYNVRKANLGGSSGGLPFEIEKLER